MKNLEGDDSLVLRILREPDSGHPAATKLTVNGVGRSEKLPDALDRQRQARSPPIVSVGRGFPKLATPPSNGIYDGGVITDASEGD